MTTGVRRNIPSGAPWENVVGYSRAVRIGEIVAVSGTTAVGTDGNVVGVGDAGVQARTALAKISDALGEAGASLDDVIRTRRYVTDIDRWPAIAEAHSAIFGDVRPAATMVEVQRLIHRDMLVEIEADAVVQPD